MLRKILVFVLTALALIIFILGIMPMFSDLAGGIVIDEGIWVRFIKYFIVAGILFAIATILKYKRNVKG